MDPNVARRGRLGKHDRTARSAWVDVVIGFRNVIRHRRRTTFNLVAIAFGLAALIIAGGFTEWIFWAAREGTIQTGLGHIQVVRHGFFASGLADPFHFLLPEQSLERQLIAQIPGVKTVAPRLAFSGLISHGDATLSFIGEGVDSEAESNFGSISIIVDGKALSRQEANGIILGRGLAETLGVKVGDPVVLLSNTAAGGVSAVEANVRGLFSTVSKAYDDSALRAPLSLAQRLMRVSQVHRWVIVLEHTDQTPQVVRTLKQKLPQGTFEVVPWYELADYYKKTVALLSKQLAVVNLIVCIIIVLTISNSLMMSVVERTGEIGTCLAIGVSGSRVMRRFIAEGMAIGLVGGLAGAGLGLGLAAAISARGIPMPPPPGGSQSYVARITVTWQIVAAAFGLGFATALIASFFPAWKASRLVIVDALRHNR